MDILKNMDIVWPSAGRAWELLHGSKVNLSSAVATATAPAGQQGRKRSAEQFREDSQFFFSPAVGPSSVSRAPLPPLTLVHNQGFPLPSVPDADANAHSIIATGLPAPYYSSYERWPSDGLSAFTGSLSTSVLPQQYSTGFVEERARAASADAAQAQRYPQFWSDYSSLGQLGVGYGMSLLAEQGLGHHHASHHASSQPQPQQQIYLQDQYQIFGEWMSLDVRHEL